MLRESKELKGTQQVLSVVHEVVNPWTPSWYEGKRQHWDAQGRLLPSPQWGEVKPGSVLLTLRAASEFRPPAELVLLVDTSESMGGAPLKDVVASLEAVLDLTQDGDLVTIMTFNSECQRVVGPIGINKNERNKAKVVVSHLTASGRTNIEKPLTMAFDAISDSKQQGPVFICLFTDGLPVEGKKTATELCQHIRDKRATIRSSRLVILDCFGFSTNHDASLLSLMARESSGRYKFINSGVTQLVQKEWMMWFGSVSSVVASRISVVLQNATNCSAAFAIGLSVPVSDWRNADARSLADRLDFEYMVNGATRNINVIVRPTEPLKESNFVVTVAYTAAGGLETKFQHSVSYAPGMRIADEKKTMSDIQHARLRTIHAISIAIETMQRRGGSPSKELEGAASEIRRQHGSNDHKICCPGNCNVYCEDLTKSIELLSAQPFNPGGLGPLTNILQSHQDERAILRTGEEAGPVTYSTPWEEAALQGQQLSEVKKRDFVPLYEASLSRCAGPVGVRPLKSCDVLEIGEDGLVEVEIVNQREEPIPATCRLFLVGSEYFHQTHAPVPLIDGHQRAKVKIALRCSDDASLETLSESRHYQLIDTKTNELLADGKFATCFGHYVGGLAKYVDRNFGDSKTSDKPPLNILLFGPAGSGKSAFTMTLLSVLDDNPERRVLHGTVEVGGAVEHVTTTLRSFFLPLLNARLWDTWGLTRETYKTGAELKSLLNGELPGNWSMEDGLAESDERTKKIIADALRTRKQRAMDAVIFLVPCGDLEDPEAMEHLKNVHGQVSRSHSPIVLLSRSDEHEPAIRDRPCDSHQAIETLRVRASKAFNVPLAAVMPCVPYCNETTRVFDIDRLAYKILETAIFNASTRRQLEQDRIQDAESKRT